MTTTTATDSDSNVPHPSYTETNRKAYNSQQEVADAWADGKYPAHNDGVLYSSPNFRGRQFDDGSGVLEHYSTREAIRTSDGLLISNQQCWSAGFAHCSTPSDIDYRLPLDAIDSLLDGGDDVFDITAVTRFGDGFGTPALVHIKSHGYGNAGKYGFVVGYDPSSTARESRYVFRVDSDELATIESADDIQALLTPAAVRSSDLEVVHSGEYTKTRLSDDEACSHRHHGGNTETYETRWRGEVTRNLQYFRADLQGKTIVRQGEWFFIPVGDIPAAPTWKFQRQGYGVEIPAGAATRVSGVPDYCRNCGASGFNVDEMTATCKTCTHVHVDPDSVGPMDIEELADRGVFNVDVEVPDGNPLGNHRPRDLRVIDGEIYVRGTVKHSGGDHDTTNLGETWHKAVTHDRDVMMYHTGPRGRRSPRTGRFD